MASPTRIEEFLELTRKSGVTDDKRLEAHVQRLRQAGILPPDPPKLAGQLIADGFLTNFQAEQLLQGKWRRFVLGKYKILEPLGSGGMGSVYLCEHKLMRRRVAVKVLPPAKAKDEAALGRFYREARAVAALDHPNIVHAYDIDQDGDLHFLIMEYVDGANLQEIIKKSGPMDVLRACHYMRQAALGLEQAHQKGLVHRDIKPGNILVDRSGVVKILDMGLARFFNDEEDILTRKFDENVLGTADYLAPEQIDDSHTVDIKADIYGLGATFFFVLAGRTVFGEGTIGQKLLWHQSRQPKPITEYRSEVPPALSAILQKCLAKAPEDRYQVPQELADALLPFTQSPIGPPPEEEMPKLSPAAAGLQPAELGGTLISKSSAPPSLSSSAPTLKGPPVSSTSGMRSPRSTPGPLAPAARNHGSAAALASAPGASQAASAAAPSQAVIDDQGDWANIAADTGIDGSLIDTGRDSRTSSLSLRISRATLVKDKKRLRTILMVVAGLFLLVLIIGFILFFRGGDTPEEKTRPRLQVTKNAGAAYQFKSIQKALAAAAPGDIIEILDDKVEENVRIDAPKEVTLQAAAGKTVHWTSPKKTEEIPLLRLSNAVGFRLNGQGITLDGALDGKRRLKNLVYITSHSPGLTLEGLQMKGFANSAVNVLNAMGDASRPIRLANLTTFTTGDEKPAAAFLFGASPDTLPPINDHIEIGAGNQFHGLDPAAAIDAKAKTMGKDVRGFPKGDSK